MHGDEGFAVFDEVDEALRVREGEFASGVAEDEAVVVFDVIDGEFVLAVFGDFVFPCFALWEEVGHGGGVGVLFGLEGFVGILW